MISGVSFGGLASGLDTEEIIASLLHLERAPIRQLTARADAKVAQREAWQKVNMHLSQLDSALRSLQDQVTFTSRIAASSREDLLAATADPSAAETLYDIEVVELARGHRMASMRFDSTVESLELSGSFYVGETLIEVGEDSSLSAIRDLVNASGADATASIIDNRLVLTSDSTGYASRLHIGDQSDDVLIQLGLMTTVQAVVETSDPDVGGIAASTEGEQYTASQLAQPVEVAGVEYRYALHDEMGVAALSVDGSVYAALTGAVDVEALEEAEIIVGVDFVFDGPVRSGRVTAVLDEVQNTITLHGASVTEELSAPRNGLFTVDGLQVSTAVNEGIDHVLEGVSIDLLGASEGTSITLRVSGDDERTLEAVGEFVDRYNTLQSYLGGLAARDGLLQGDSTLMRLQSMLRQLVTSPVELGSPGLSQAAHVGIQVDRHGVMSLDEAALRGALETDAGAVHRIFGASADGDGADGIARRLADGLHSYLRFGDGLLSQRDRLYERMLRDFDDRVEFMERRVLRREDSLRRQFAGLESMLSTLYSQSQWLDAQISNLNSMRRSDP